jgi:tetratricopeptide (TPR) repeat protein
LDNLGLAYANLGEYGKAIDYYEQALEIECDIGDRQGECFTLFNKSLILEKRLDSKRKQWSVFGKLSKSRSDRKLQCRGRKAKAGRIGDTRCDQIKHVPAPCRKTLASSILNLDSDTWRN